MLLAAGEGTRLRPLTTVLPKCLMPINGVPLLEYWLQAMAGMGVTEILVNTSYKSELVRDFLKSRRGGPKIRITYEPELLGTAGTLAANLDWVGREDLVLVHADNLSIFNPAEFLRAFTERPRGALATLMTFDTDTPHSCGILKLDAKGMVQELHEKVPHPPGNLANAAVYILSKEFIAEVHQMDDLREFSTQVLPRLLKRANAFHNSDYHRDIGTLESYRVALRDMLARPTAAEVSAPDSELWSAWVEAWRQVAAKVAVARGPAELSRLPEDLLNAEVVLVESAERKELAILGELSQNHPRSTFVLWKAV